MSENAAKKRQDEAKLTETILKLKKIKETYGISDDPDEIAEDAEDIISGGSSSSSNLAPISEKTAWLIGKYS